MTDTYLTTIPATDPPFSTVRDWRNQEQVHKVVMSLFPAHLPGDPQRPRAHHAILYRVEAIAGSHRVLVQSATPPNAGTSKKLTRVLNEIETGDPLIFRLQANAVEVEARTKRRRPVPANQIEPWLTKRLPGAQLTHISDARTVPLNFVRDSVETRLHTIVVDGELLVTDHQQFIELIIHGVGKARSYGCGLLSVATI